MGTTQPAGFRLTPGVFAAVGTAVVGSLFALWTGLGQGIGNATEQVTTTSSTSIVAPADVASR
jgi:hypothetical protein